MHWAENELQGPYKLAQSYKCGEHGHFHKKTNFIFSSTNLHGERSIVALHLACLMTASLSVMCHEPSHHHYANFAVVQLVLWREMQSDASEFHMFDCPQLNCCSITISLPLHSTFTEATHIEAGE